MSDDPTTGLRSLDPLAGREVDEDLLAEGRESLVEEIFTLDPEPDTSKHVLKGTRRFRPLRVGTVLGIIGAIAIAILLTGNGGSSRDHTANAAYTVRVLRFAESTPLVLLEPPAWKVRYVFSSSDAVGGIVFRRKARDFPIEADLNWHGGRLKKARYTEVYRRSIISRNAPVLGTKALVYSQGFSKEQRRMVIVARWRFDGRILEMRSMVPDERTFLEMLAALKQVRAETWLDAMPESVIKAADSSTTIKQMLKGVPLPPGFDSSGIEVPGLAQDRYQVGAIVTGAVTCAWFDYWSKARISGDEAAESEAAEAMATARDWPVLRQMSKQGAYPKVVWSYADHMRSGTYFERPLAREVNASLGCKNLLAK